MSITEKIKEYLKNYKGEQNYGAQCRFLPFGNKFGIKSFWTQYVRDCAFFSQMKFYNLGLAPFCYENSFVTIQDSFSYVTKRLTVLCEYSGEYFYVDGKKYLNNEPSLFNIRSWGHFKDAIAHFVKMADKKGVKCYDNHPGNYGVDDELNLMRIDFS